MTATELPQAPEADAVGAPVERPVRPVAAHMLTEDGSRHHLRFDVREVERTAKHMRQRCVMLYDQAALDGAVAAERERWATAARLCVEATPEQLPLALDALRDVLEA